MDDKEYKECIEYYKGWSKSELKAQEAVVLQRIKDYENTIAWDDGFSPEIQNKCKEDIAREMPILNALRYWLRR